MPEEEIQQIKKEYVTDRIKASVDTFDSQPEPQIPPKPKMSASAVAYPKLHKIYKELVKQNETIFLCNGKRAQCLRGKARQSEWVIRRCRTSTESIMQLKMLIQTNILQKSHMRIS